MSKFRRVAYVVAVAAVGVTLASSAPGAVPSRLHVIDISQMTDAELVLVQSLQGIVAKDATDGTPQIWISGEIDPGLLDYLRARHSISLSLEGDALSLLAWFLRDVTGYERCDLTLRSLNVAAPLAGVEDAVIAASPEMAEKLSSYLGLGLKTDVRQFDEWYWLGGRFGDLDPELLIEQGILGPARLHVRDLSASRKAFTFWNDQAGGSGTLRSTAMALTDPHSYVLGFPQDLNERDWIREASFWAHPAVRAERCHNLSVLSGIGRGETFNQRAETHVGPVATADGVHYVCIVMDGGWDIGWTLNEFGGPNWFGNARRGDFPMNWEVSPALVDFAPAALGFLYSQSADSDFFVSAASGYGLLYPDQYPDLAGYAARLGPKVKQADLRVVNVMGDAGGALSDAGPLLSRPEVLGVFYKTNNAAGDSYTGISAGSFDVSDGKVIWPYRYALWNNGASANTASEIAASILTDSHRSPTTDPLSYSLVAVHPKSYWDGDPGGSSIMDEVANLADRLRADPAVRLVSAEEFAWRLRENFGDGRSGPRFPDVPTTNWAWEDVEAVAEADISAGFLDGKYHPEITVTRDQMAMFIARGLAGGDSGVPSGPAVPTFSDVPKTHWAYDHIEYLAGMEMVTGYPGGRYRPGAEVNRGQMAVFIARAAAGGDAAVPPAEPPDAFADVTATNAWSWAHRYVEYAAEVGIVGGYPDGLYRPATYVTRDQMAVYIARAFGLMEVL